MNKEIVSFNSGEMTPKTDALSNIEKYAAGCRHLENMIPRIYGSAERRPGTLFVYMYPVFVSDTILVYPTLHELTRELPSIVSCDDGNLSYENQTVESDVEEENRIYHNGKLVSYEDKQVFYFGVGSTNFQANFVPVPIFTHYENDIICWENETIKTTGEIVYTRNVICYENDTIFWEYDTVVASAEIPTAPPEPYVKEIHQVYYDKTTPNLANREVVTYEDDPVFYYENWSAVTTAADLQAMEKNRRYYLTGDIDLTGETWTPITAATKNFTLDGRGYTISNLTIAAAGADNQGLFGTFPSGGKIYDLILADFSITGADDYVGALIGKCSTGGAIILKDITITNPTISGDDYVGGMIGYIDDLNQGRIFDCSVTGAIITGGAYIGGMFGGIYCLNGSTGDTQIVRCYSTGVIATDSYHIGGIAGETWGDKNTAPTADVYLYFHTCYSTVTITGTDTGGTLGGFIATIDGAIKCVTCYATGDIIESEDVDMAGGFAYMASPESILINCYATGDLTLGTSGSANSFSIIGGFLGKVDFSNETIIRRCYSTGDITLYPSGGNAYSIGGFIGDFLGPAGVNYTVDGLCERCWSTGDIYIDNETGINASGDGIGGFGGTVTGVRGTKSAPFTIQNCYSWGSITTGTANDNTRRGGFIGSVDAIVTKKLTLTNCYDAQTSSEWGSGLSNQITAGTYSGGLVGYEVTADTVTNTATFWDTDTSDISISEYGTGQDTDDMMTKSNYTNWDFNNIWEMVEL